MFEKVNNIVKSLASLGKKKRGEIKKKSIAEIKREIATGHSEIWKDNKRIY